MICICILSYLTIFRYNITLNVVLKLPCDLKVALTATNIKQPVSENSLQIATNLLRYLFPYRSSANIKIDLGLF